MRWLFVVAGLGAIGPTTRLEAQVADQVVVYTYVPGSGHAVLRFDRKLNQLGLTDVSGEGGVLEVINAIATDGTGQYWIPFDALNNTKLLRIDSRGQLLPSSVLGHNPVAAAATAAGNVYALTRIPLSAPAPLYAVSGSGSVLWSSWKGPAQYKGLYPAHAAVTPQGELWIGGSSHVLCQFCPFQPLLVDIAPAGGTVLQTLALPLTNLPDTFSWYLAAAPDGTLWSLQSEYYLVHTDGRAILGTFFIDAGSNGLITHIRVDAAGDVWATSTYTAQGAFGSRLLKFSGQDGSVLAQHDTGNLIQGFALGAAGEDILAVTSNLSPPFYRLVRINLVTGVRSRVSLDPLQYNTIANGDPTGFIYANVVDQDGDNDGDGATNRQETLAGSSPYDPLSRPDGPKVYISFALSNNAIILKFVDPDGLLDPVGGLNLSTLSVKLGPYGEVFNYLLPFLTFVQLSPDLTSATALFGALPLASNQKWPLEATVADKTGAVGWDWQVTPPGDL